MQEAAKTGLDAAAVLVNYGAIGVCLVLALIALWFVDKDRTKILKRLENEQAARVEDAKAYMQLALDLQQAETKKLEKLETIAGILKDRARG